MSSDIPEKARALFLAALMVLSVVGMTTAFAGSAAAQVGGSPTITDSQPVEPEATVTVEIDSSSVPQGNDIYVAYDGDGDDTIQEDEVVKVVASSNSGTQSIEFTPTDAAEVDISTSITETVAVFEDPSGDQADGDTESDDFTVSDSTEGSVSLNVDPAADDELVVNDDGSAEYTDISAAVGASDSQDTIIVEAGTYNEDVVINTDDLTLTGAGASQTTLAGADGGPDTLSVNDASGLTVSGFTIEAGSNDAAVDVRTADSQDNLEFSQNTFVGSGDVPATVFVGANHEDVSFTGNIFTTADGATASKYLFLGGEATYGTGDESATSSDNADTVTGNNFEGAVSDVALEVESQHSTVTGNDFGAVSPTSDVAIPGAVGDGNSPNIKEVNGETDRNAQILSVIENNDDVTTTNPYAVEVSPTQAAIGSTATVEGTLLGTGDTQRSVSYEIQEPESSNAIASGSTSDASFSTLVEFTESGDYEVALTSETGDPAATISSTFTINNQTVDPAEPILGDDVTVSGQVVDSEGGVDVGTIAIANEGAADDASPVATASTTSSGQFQLQTTINDADEFEFRNVTTNGDLGIVYSNFTVGPADANVTLESDGDNNAGFAQTYTVTVQDGNGNAVDFTGAGDFEGYVNVTGEFSGTPSLVADNADSDEFETYNTDGDSAIEVIRVDPDADGDFQFDATPTADGDPVTATLENNDAPAAFDVTTLGDNEIYGGIEETASGDSPDAPDFVGSDELAVSSAGNLNVDVTTSPDTVFSTEDSTVDVSVVGADGNPPDGDADDSNDLSNATVSVSGPGVDVDNQVIDTNDDSNSGNPASFAVNPDEAGELTIDVTGVADDGTEFSTNETVDVTGDLIESVSPTDVAIEDNRNVTVEVANANGQAINNREVTISSQGNAVFSVDETTGVSEVIIDAGASEVRDGSSNVLQSITVNNGQYTVNNVTFTAPGDLDVTVSSGGQATDQDTDTAQQTAAISVQGVEAFDVAVDKEPLVTGVTERVNVSVTEDGAAVNGSALDDLTRSITQDDASVASNVQTVDTNDDNTVDVIQADVTPTATDSAVNVTVSTSNQARTGSTSVNVEAPVIATNVTDNTLTERLTTTAELTVENPRTGEQIDGADIQFTVFNGTAAVAGDANGGFSTEGSSSDGSGTAVDSTGDLADGNTTVDLQAYSPADNGDFVVSLGAQVDGNFVTATNLSVEPMQVTASPDRITLGETATVTINAQDANGNAIANQRVDIAGAGVNIEDAGTDNGGVVNVQANPQATGNIGIFVDSDDSVAGTGPDQVTDDTNPQTTREAEIPVQTEQQSTFGINEGTLEPNTVTGNQTVTHTLTFSVDSLSNDGNSDTFTVTLPSSVEITGANSVNVTDANGSAIQVTSSPSLSDANGGTNNQVQFGVQPGDSALDTSTVTVEASIDVAFPAVNESVTAPVNASVADSTAGSTGPTTVADVTIQPEAADDQPVATVTFDDKTVQNGTEEVTVESANFTRADGSAGDYVVVVHVVNETRFDRGVDNSISAPVGASGNLSNGAENITVDLNSSAAFEDGDALDSLTENVTLRAMLHTTDNDSAFGTRLGSAIDGLEPGDETDDANITVQEEAGVPEDPAERALQAAGVNNASAIEQSDITTLITLRDRGDPANGVDVTQDDITNLITLRDRAQ